MTRGETFRARGRLVWRLRKWIAFMRRNAQEAAEVEMLGRTAITIPAKDWEQFEAWVGAPGEAIPALQQLGGIKPSWER